MTKSIFKNIIPAFPLYRKEEREWSPDTRRVSLSTRVKVVRDQGDDQYDLFSLVVCTDFSYDPDEEDLKQEIVQGESFKQLLNEHLRNCIKIAKFHKVEKHRPIEYLINEGNAQIVYHGTFTLEHLLINY